MRTFRLLSLATGTLAAFLLALGHLSVGVAFANDFRANPGEALAEGLTQERRNKSVQGISQANARGKAQADTDGKSFTILVPDPRNDVVHRVSSAGRYLGDFLDAARHKGADLSSREWLSPRGLLVLPGDVPRVWMIAERALSEWTSDGRHLRSLFSDSLELEDPTGIVRIGGRVVVVSEDKKRWLVFDEDGRLLSSIEDRRLDRSRDLKVSPDGMLLTGGLLRSWKQDGLIAGWDPENFEKGPVAHFVPPVDGAAGPATVASLVFDDGGNLLIVDHARGTVERWNTETNERIEVLLDSGQPGSLQRIDRGPDGLIYLAGSAGIYRFPAGATAGDLKKLEVFFDASTIRSQYDHPFTPASLTFLQAD